MWHKEFVLGAPKSLTRMMSEKKGNLCFKLTVITSFRIPLAHINTANIIRSTSPQNIKLTNKNINNNNNKNIKMYSVKTITIKPSTIHQTNNFCRKMFSFLFFNHICPILNIFSLYLTFI